MQRTTTPKERAIVGLVVFVVLFLAFVFIHHFIIYGIVLFVLLTPLLLLNKFINWILPGHKR